MQKKKKKKKCWEELGYNFLKENQAAIAWTEASKWYKSLFQQTAIQLICPMMDYTSHLEEYFQQSCEEALKIQFKFLNIIAGVPWYVINLQQHKDLEVPPSTYRCKEYCTEVDSKITNLENLIVWQLGRDFSTQTMSKWQLNSNDHKSEFGSQILVNGMWLYQNLLNMSSPIIPLKIQELQSPYYIIRFTSLCKNFFSHLSF